MTWSSSPSWFTSRRLATALLLGAASLAAAADFEGLIESRMKLSGEAGVAGTSRTFVSAAGTRQEMTFGKKGESMTMATLVLRSKPGLTYLVNDDKKSYTELDLASMKGAAAEKSSEKYTVTRLGDEKVAGYDCAHGKVQGSKGDRYEVWSTREISGAEDFWAGQEGGQQGQGSVALYRAMKQAGLDGWPLKMVFQSKSTGKGTMTWEATRVERKSLPGSLFSLAGYKKGEGGTMGAMGQMKLSPAQQKEMDDAMKDLSPEQRKQMEEMMKGMQGGK